MTNPLTIHLDAREISMLNELCRIHVNSHSEVIARLIREEYISHHGMCDIMSEIEESIKIGTKKRYG